MLAIKNILVILSGILVSLGALVFLLNNPPVEKAAGNPSTISRPGVEVYSTGSATGTPSFITAGTGTSTLTLDTINQISTTTQQFLARGTVTNAVALNEAWLALQFTGSSTASRVKIDWEYSNDGIDFYQDNATSTTLSYASSTALSGLGVSEQPTLTSTGNIVNKRLIEVPKIPARFIRAVISVPIGFSNMSTWAQFIVRQQR